MDYELELERAAAAIMKKKHKTVLLQLPDGLKPKAKEIADHLFGKTGATIIIWCASCYGSCDLPTEAERLGASLVIQWGHNAFAKERGW